MQAVWDFVVRVRGVQWVRRRMKVKVVDSNNHVPQLGQETLAGEGSSVAVTASGGEVGGLKGYGELKESCGGDGRGVHGDD